MSRISKLNYNSRMIYYLATTTNFARSVNLRLIFSIQEIRVVGYEVAVIAS